MTELTLEAVVADIGQLPVLPEVVLDLLNAIDAEDVDVDSIAHKVAREQALAARCLRVANSSFYGLQGSVATIQEAMMVLGFRSMRTLVVAAGVTTRFETLQLEGFDHRAFWLHSVGAAMCGRALGPRLAVDAEVAFTACLMHDLGRLVLVSRFPEEFHRIAGLQLEQDGHGFEAERSVLGFDHAQIGAALARRWRFAAEVADGIAFHHAPESGGALAGLVHLADATAHALDFPGGEGDLVPDIAEPAWQRSGLTWTEFKKVLGEVDSMRGEVSVFLA